MLTGGIMIEQYLQVAVQYIKEICLKLNTVFGLEETQAFKFLKPYFLQLQDNPTYIGIAIVLLAVLSYSLYKIISIPRKRINKLNDREQNINELEKKHNDREKNVNELEKKLNDRRNHLNELEKKRNDREKNVNELEKILNDRRKHLNELEQKLNDRKKHLNALKDGMEGEQERIDIGDHRVIGIKDYDQALAYSKQGNYNMAFLFYKNAAEHDHAKAQFELGTLYYRGQGVAQSYDKAIKWYKKSAEQGNPDAQSHLSEIYRIIDDLEEYEPDEIDQQLQPKINQDKEEIAAIKTFVKERNIEHLIHFTRYENLESILDNGIVTKDVLNTSNLDFYGNDGMRLDGHQNSISLSLSSPNHKMLYKYKKQSDAKGWIVIDVNPEVLWEYNCAFCKHNAADSRILKRNIDDLCNIKSFKEMFLDPNDGSREGLETYHTTDPQAEVLVFNNIPIKHIQNISFEREDLLEITKSKYNKSFTNNINFIMAKPYFEWGRVKYIR